MIWYAIVILHQLFHADMQDKPLGAVADTVLNMEAWHNPNSEETKQYLKETVGITTEGRYFNGGVILFDIDRLREDGEKLLACAGKGSGAGQIRMY